MTIAKEILSQLGGNKFIAMTGSKNFVYENASENQNFYLRMDLARNSANVNRLKIEYTSQDLYIMTFYRQTTTKTWDVKISNERKIEGVYCDQLREIFENVTGLRTSL